MKSFPLFVAILVIAGCNGPEEKKPAAKTEPVNSAAKETKTILFFGNSLTAGYGLDDPSEALPALIQEKIDSVGMPYKVVNAGLSGETSAGGKSRIDWILKQKIDVFVLELGANDGLRGLPVTETLPNLQAIMDKVKARYPGAKQVLLGMEVPPNMGNGYVMRFRAIFRHLAEKNQVTFLPFMLDHVAGIQSLNQRDGIHPNKAGTQIVAANVWTVLEPTLK